MTTTITRMYATEAQAAAAVDQLKQNRSWRGTVTLVSLESLGGGDVPLERIANAIEEAGLHRNQALTFAKAVKQGPALVTVIAPFGTAQLAQDVLEGFKPMAGAAARADHYSGATIGPAPFSSLFNLPVLSRNPAPFSSFWNISPISSGGTRAGRGWRNTLSLPFPALSRKRGSFLPFATLSRSSKPAASVSRSRGPVLPFPTLLKHKPRSTLPIIRRK